MPIMAAHGRNDARGAALLLAMTAKDCILDPSIAADREVALNNVYQLLEGYRADVYSDLRRRSTRQIEGAAGTLTLMPRAEQHVGDVRVALDQAVANVFSDTTKDGAVKILERVLKSVAYPKKFGTAPEGDRTKAVEFFDEMLHILKFV